MTRGVDAGPGRAAPPLFSVAFHRRERVPYADDSCTPRRNTKTAMPDTPLAALKKLARQKLGLKEQVRLVAKVERRLVQNLSRVLPTIGYRLVRNPGCVSAGLRLTSWPGRERRPPSPKARRRDRPRGGGWGGGGFAGALRWNRERCSGLPPAGGGGGGFGAGLASAHPLRTRPS